MKNLLPSGTVLLLVTLSIYQCCSTARMSTLPEAAASFINTLHQDAQPVKSIVDQKNGDVYWLSFVGNLHSLKQDGSQHNAINQDTEAWKDVTFIEDFCLNETQDSLYFTDLMDLKTGESAIKVTDIKGKRVKVVAHLEHEIPYHLSLSADKSMLFFLSKANMRGKPFFRLRFVNLKEGSKGTLYASLSKIDSLHYDPTTQEVNIHTIRQEQFVFSADLQSMMGLAEAFKHP